jgi:hypothetical protein
MMTSPSPDDVGAVLAALRAEVRARRLAQAPGAAASALDQELARCVEQLEITRVVSAHWPLESRTPLARAQNLVNKLVRRALRWYINPIVEQQNAFNDVAARTLRLLVDAYAEIERRKANGESDDDSAAPSALEGAEKRGETTAPSGAAEKSEPGAPSAFGLQPSDLQRAVRELAGDEPRAALADLGLPPLELAAADRAAVHAHWDLGPGPGPAAQRLVRRYLRWLINPIVEQQNAFNAALAASIRPLIRLDAEARARAATRRWKQRQGDKVTR